MAHTITFHLIRAAKKIQNELGLKTETVDLSSSEACALLIIDSQKDINQIDIAQKLHLAPASVVSLIDELENHQLVTRKTPKCDRRKYQICLTVKGLNQIKKIKAKTNEIEIQIKNKLSNTEIQTLHSALGKISGDYPTTQEHIINDKNINVRR